jgi:hypothetical protein
MPLEYLRRDLFENTYLPLDVAVCEASEKPDLSQGIYFIMSRAAQTVCSRKRPTSLWVLSFSCSLQLLCHLSWCSPLLAVCHRQAQHRL